MKYEDIYKWTTCITTEQILDVQRKEEEMDDPEKTEENNIFNLYEDYYWTPEAEKVYRLIQMGLPSLIKVVGLQGVGKSALLYVLKTRLKRDKSKKNILALNIKDISSSKFVVNKHLVVQQMGKRLIEKMGGFEALHNYLMQFPSFKSGERRNKIIDKIQSEEKQNFSTDLDELFEIFRQKLSSKYLREIFENAKIEETTNAQALLFDFPDYEKKNYTTLRKHLDDFQSYWRNIRGESLPCPVVLFFQKEIVDNYKHFLFGKMISIELKPIPSSVLVDIYIKKWKSTAPFTQEALLEVAQTSHGIFRRFLRYIQLCLDEFCNQGESIVLSLDVVKKTINLDVVAEDMDTELSGIFPSEEQRTVAIKVYEYIRQKGVVYREELQRIFFDNRSPKTSRLLDKLEKEGYIKEHSREGPKILFALKKGENKNDGNQS